MARVKKIASQDGEGEEERIDFPIKPVQSSSDDSDSDSDSDDSADSEVKTQAITRDDVDTAATSKRKLTTTDTAATSKRKLTTTDTTDTTTTAKKSKKYAAGTSNNAKQPQRIWTDDYEISLLKGMVEFKKDKGTEPSGNLFFDFIKNYLTLNFELSKSQLSDKIYRLRKKYKANVEKAGYGEPVFDKPHDQNVFKLSKKIWGRDAVGEEVSKFEMFQSSVVDVTKELEFPEFWDRFIKKRILKGDEMARLLQENELKLKLKKNEIQRKKHELELAQFRAS